MPELVTVEIKGAEQLKETLDALPPRIRGQVMLAALRQGGNLIREAYRDKIPVRSEPGRKRIGRSGSKSRLPGFARRSVIVAKSRTSGQGGYDQIEVGASRRAFYLMFLEFGTAHISPRGWLRQAFQQQEANALAVIGGAIWLNIQRAIAMRGGSSQ